jgi:hypothetical protein
MLRILLLCIAVSACHRWVGVYEPTQVHDERVIVDRGNGTTQTLEHAHACGEGTVGGGHPGAPPCDCATTCTLVNVDDVRVRRVDPWRTAGVIAAVTAGAVPVVLATAFFVALGNLNLNFNHF